MSRIHPGCPDSDPPDRLPTDVLVREELDEDDDDEDDEGDRKKKKMTMRTTKTTATQSERAPIHFSG